MSSAGRPVRILYVVYWGLREPLGEALVVPAVKELARRGAHVRIISFEKPEDLAELDKMADLQRSLGADGVAWRALRYHKRPSAPAKVFDVIRGVGVGVGFWRERPEVIHARTFVGGLMGLLLRVLLGVPLIYHNEGFWPDEQVEGGFWKSGSWTYRVCKALETVIYGRADGLVLLSKRSFPFVQALPAVRRRQPPTAVVPSCVDLGRFVPVPRQTSRPLRLIYVGNLGGRYPMEPMVGFLNALRRLEPDATVTILSQSDLENVRTRLAALGLPESAWTLSRARHSDVPEYLNRAHAGLAVRSPGIGAFSSSPTKIGEYWASGLPVVTTPGLGDTDALIEERRVGVILRHADADAYETAARELITLLADPDLTTRCRQAAEDCYSLERGVDTQLALYRSVLDHARPVALTCDR